METITITAKTIEEAITKATIQLGVTSSNLGYDVIEKGSAGFLGIGSKNSVIKAYRKEDLPVEEIKEEKKPIEEPVVVEVKEEVKEDVKIEKEEIKPVVKEEVSSVSLGDKKQYTKNNNKSHSKNHHKNHGKKDGNKHTAKEEKVEVKKETKREPREVSKIDESTILVTKKFIEDVLKAMEIEAEVVTAVDEEGALEINIDGKNMGVLIGKRGQTLDSLQYLANRVANKEQDGYVRVKLDTENYRERRKKTLENLAKNIAYKVRKTRKPVSLEPMNPYERRIIHSALQDDNRVSTHSEGDEPYRHVVVTLARK